MDVVLQATIIASMEISFEKMKRWGFKGGIAILDQGLFSGSNFLLNVFLARWLRPEEYGAFSIAFAIYLFFSGFHNAFVLEPVSIFGTSKYSTILREYLGGQLFIHCVVTGISSFLILIVGLVLYFSHVFEEFLSLSIIGVGVFLPFMLLIWLARRACYVSGKPRLAFAASLVYSVVIFAGAVSIHRTGLTNPLYWYFLMGVAGLLGSILVYLNPVVVNYNSSTTTKWRSWLSAQYSYGKWIFLAAFLNFAGTQIQIFVVALQLGLNQTGAFRAIQNFMLPMMQVITAISTLMLPMISSQFGQQKFQTMKDQATKIALVLMSVSAVYLAVLIVFAEPAELLLYNGKFAKLTPLLSLAGIVPVITALEVGFSLVIRSLQKPVYYAVSTGAVALSGVLFTPIMVFVWGLQGALVSLILVTCTSLLINIWLYRMWFVPILTVETIER